MLQEATLNFLSELKDNNQRDWFDDNRKRYKAAKDDVTSLVNELLIRLASLDPKMEGLEAKQCMFRIFRDVRFSKDKAPYKTNMGAWMAPGGRKSVFAGYYLHIEPGGNSFLAGGSYMPPSNVLKAIREAIDYDPDALRTLLADPKFKSTFGELGGEKLKSSPRDYPKDHPAIDLLRHKSLVVDHRIKDATLTKKSFVDNALEVYETMKPLTDFLNKGIAEMEA